MDQLLLGGGVMPISELEETEVGRTEQCGTLMLREPLSLCGAFSLCEVRWVLCWVQNKALWVTKGRRWGSIPAAQ